MNNKELKAMYEITANYHTIIHNTANEVLNEISLFFSTLDYILQGEIEFEYEGFCDFVLNFNEFLTKSINKMLKDADIEPFEDFYEPDYYDSLEHPLGNPFGTIYTIEDLDNESLFDD